MTSVRKLDNLSDQLALVLNHFEALHLQISHLQVRDLNARGSYFLGVAQSVSDDIQDRLVAVIDALHALSHHTQAQTYEAVLRKSEADAIREAAE